MCRCRRVAIAFIGSGILFHDPEHFDLLHSARYACRGLWTNCRLVTIERDMPGVIRENDQS